MKIRNSITAKLVLSTAIGVFIVLLLTGVFAVKYVGESAQNELDNGIKSAIKLNASGIEHYFKAHATRVERVFRNTGLIDWFAQHRVRGEGMDTPEFARVVDILQREVDAREDIISIFFGSKYSGEYFHETGLSKLEGYNVLGRPWWTTVRDSKEWSVSGVTFEPQYNHFYVSMNFPIYDFDKEFIGVGGVDVYLTAINELISKIQYENQGQAFLLDKTGDMIVFPDEKLAEIDVANRETTNIKLAQLDQQKGNSGFETLLGVMENSSHGIDEVTWRDTRYYVQYQNVDIPELSVSWKLAIMVPVDYVEAPVNRAIKSVVFIIIAILLVTLLVLYFTTSRLLNPLYQVKQALVEIAGGAGDLSQSIPVKSNDEIGELSIAFNSFVEQIQNIVSRVQVTSVELKETTAKVAQVSEGTVNKTGLSQQELQQATETVVQMAENAHVIKEQISSARESAQIASTTSTKGQAVLSNSMEGLSKLNENFDSAVHTIEELRESSHAIGEVMDVIRNIADQTNLLALNAAIESARAGEHGRGFAVVADEVRQLARRTQESTESIQSSINDLQDKAKLAEESMSTTREQVNQYRDDTHVVHSQLTDITVVVDQNSDNMQDIVDITQEQDTVSQSIRNMMQQVNEIGDETSAEAQSLMGICSQLEDKTERLTELVKRFKV